MVYGERKEALQAGRHVCRISWIETHLEGPFDAAIPVILFCTTRGTCSRIVLGLNMRLRITRLPVSREANMRAGVIAWKSNERERVSVVRPEKKNIALVRVMK